MAKRYITADWHLGDDRFQIMCRPGFLNAQDMVDKFVDWHNEIVSPDDLVLMVGDACNLNSPEFLPQVARFNGTKILFRGNHDRVFTDEQLEPYFAQIVPEGEGKLIDIGGEKFNVTHYPTQSRGDVFNLVGHIHGAWKVQLNALNVGVDANHFRPLDIDVDVPFLRKAVQNFFDDDVWAAYSDSQAIWHGRRGKPGRYLDQDGLVGG